MSDAAAAKGGHREHEEPEAKEPEVQVKSEKAEEADAIERGLAFKKFAEDAAAGNQEASA